MKNGKKVLLICLCAVALVAASVFGTLAYLTSQDTVVNTFIVGKVAITVDEAKVTPDGVPEEGADRVKENHYHLLPGLTYTKDPTMTVKADSEDSYVRMILKVHNASGVQDILTKYDLGDFSALIGGWDKETWLYEDFEMDEEENVISFEFRYKEIVSGGEQDQVLPALFTSLIVPGQTTGEEILALQDNGFKMEIEGHAIQAAGFTDQKDEAGEVVKTAQVMAWEAFEAQLAAQQEAENPTEPTTEPAVEPTTDPT